MKAILPLLIVLLFAGCATHPLPAGCKTPTSAAELRAKGKFLATVDYSGSMRPLLKGGDELLVTVVPFEQVRAGMVVVYWPHWKHCPVVHLVVGEAPGGFRCKGIDNPDMDPEPMTAATFIGVASKINEATPLIVALK
jgi:signal peptidase I